MSDAPTYYKFLDANQTGRYSRKRLPIGEWIGVDGPLEMCANGIHVTTIEHALEWLDERAHIVEIRGEHIVGDNKLCCREVYIHPALPAWNEQSARLLAADFAEHVLHIFESQHPGDDRPRKAIEAARSFARGDIDNLALAASRAAARAAAVAAAGDAAGAAAVAAAHADAHAAAWDAARAAAHADAWGAAWDAERQWQTERLAEYLNGNAMREVVR